MGTAGCLLLLYMSFTGGMGLRGVDEAARWMDLFASSLQQFLYWLCVIWSGSTAA